jgi:hypothetical protein
MPRNSLILSERVSYHKQYFGLVIFLRLRLSFNFWSWWLLRFSLYTDVTKSAILKWPVSEAAIGFLLHHKS